MRPTRCLLLQSTLCLWIAFQAAALSCRAEESTDIVALDSSSIDKAGGFRFSYSIGGGCTKHSGRVLIELKTDSSNNMNVVSAARVKIQDVTAKPDPCASTSMTAVEGHVDLQSLLQQAADEQSAVIGDQRIPISLPDTSVFTGK